MRTSSPSTSCVSTRPAVYTDAMARCSLAPKRSRTLVGESCSRFTSASRRAGSTSPVRAETSTASGRASWRARLLSGPSWSTLFSTSMRGRPSAPISARTSSTAVSRSAMSLADASITCSIRSASVTSSSVARNATTSECGSFWMKPTVSTISASWPAARRARRTSGSRVMKSWSEAAASARVSAENSVDFPAFV
jgi:hypothetical protein